MQLDWDEGPRSPARTAPYRQTERQAIYRSTSRGCGHRPPLHLLPHLRRARGRARAAQADKRAWVYSGACRDLTPAEVARRKAAGEPWTLRFQVRPGHDPSMTCSGARSRSETTPSATSSCSAPTAPSPTTWQSSSTTSRMAITPRHPRRRPSLQHAQAGPDLQGARRGAAALSAHAAAVRHRSQEALQAPRRDQPRAAHRHGYLVEVVRNYLCFLSTEFDESMITWTLADLVSHFDVEALGTSPSIFDPDKLRWMNGRFIRAGDPADLPPAAELPRADRLLRAAAGAAPAGDRWRRRPVRRRRGRRARAPAARRRAGAPHHLMTPFVQEKMEVLADFVRLAGWMFTPLAISARPASA